MLCSIVGNTESLPPPPATLEEDDALFVNEPHVEAPVRVNYGIHLSVSPGVMMKFNFVVLDICCVTIGARVLFGPNVPIFSAFHPLDSKVRKGFIGPECGKDIHIGDNCRVGGNVIFLAGMMVGRGCIIGAGSVVTKSVEPFTVVDGNPARVIKRLENTWADD
jgi:acetyltransferase-like isoleucine patch superfamily enzyme